MDVLPGMPKTQIAIAARPAGHDDVVSHAQNVYQVAGAHEDVTRAIDEGRRSLGRRSARGDAHTVHKPDVTQGALRVDDEVRRDPVVRLRLDDLDLASVLAKGRATELNRSRVGGSRRIWVQGKPVDGPSISLEVQVKRNSLLIRDCRLKYSNGNLV